MEGTIAYIVTVQFKENTHTFLAAPSHLDKLHDTLMDYDHGDPEFQVLDVRRRVISSKGRVTFTQHWLTFDMHGLSVFDAFGNLVDSYSVPEPEKKRYKVIRNETWTNEVEVEATSEEEALKIVNELVTSGAFDVLDGWLSDTDHDIWEA